MVRSLRVCALVAVLVSGPGLAFAFTTMVDEMTRTVRVDFTDLPPYEQIRLEGVEGLFWCPCNDPDNPSSLASSGFNPNGTDLEMQYEGVAPPSTNYIEYTYLDEYAFNGFESVDWVLVTELGGNELVLTGDRPIIEFVPEPTTASLSSLALAAVAVLAGIRHGLDRARAAVPARGDGVVAFD
jgi:hypothetical protein